MSTFVPPAGLGSVIPSSPTQGVVIGSSDQVVLDYIVGKTIIGGGQFSDTLGRFFPVTINNTGIMINSAGTNSSGIVFHNTTTVGTDELVTMGTPNALVVVPNSATSVNNPLVIADRTTVSYLGWAFYPAVTSGGATQPEIDAVSPPGTGNVVYRFGANYIQFAGGPSGSSPSIYMVGADANINLFIQPKGAGSINIGSGTGNYVNFPASASGTSQVQIAALGADANITIFLIPKGSGSVGLGVQYANYWSAVGAPIGSPPNLSVVGADANINLPLSPKGTGVVYFNYAGTALGGGAAPALGTIGGAGPAVAAQNEWMKVIVNGNVRFIPLWA